MALSEQQKIARWRSLVLDDQLRIARSVVKNRGRDFKAMFANVLSIGIGYKHRRDKNQIIRRNRRCICIRFSVEKKLKRIKGEKIPGSIDVYVQIDGKRQLAAIPTDVDILGHGRPQSLLPIGNGFRSYPQGNTSFLPSTGSCLCMVRQLNNPSIRYLLGCSHVFAASTRNAYCDADPLTVTHDYWNNLYIGNLYDYRPLRPLQGHGLDAALVQVADSSWLAPSFGGVTPQRYSDGFYCPPDCAVFAPRGRIPARFSEQQYDVTLDYGVCGGVFFETLYRFTAATLPGDSGSPLMSPDGTLYAMHIWGDPATGIAYSIPAYVLFRPGLFLVDFDI